MHKLPTFKTTWGPKIRRKIFSEKIKKNILRNVLKIIYPKGFCFKMSENMFKKKQHPTCQAGLAIHAFKF